MLTFLKNNFNRRIVFFLLALLLPFLTVRSQQLKIMHYNILYFGYNTGFCNSNNNNYEVKGEALATIVDHVQPDILTVNEIASIEAYHEYILEHSLNVNGVTHWAKADPPNNGGSVIMNQIYFNTDKLTLQETTSLTTNYRDIDIFKLNYNDAGEEAILYCVVAHLKAGDNAEDEQERTLETQILMDYLDENEEVFGDKNMLFMGDFNFYSAYEDAYIEIINNSNTNIRFYDPINTYANWHNNGNYADIHTQSTHTSAGCAATGGMDDRFDFILMSNEIKDGFSNIRYKNNSYQAIGQDGLHFNENLLDSPTNTTVPEEVLNALYTMSDHLPVVLELKIGNLGIDDIDLFSEKVSFNNPVRNTLNITFHEVSSRVYFITLLSIEGQMVSEASFKSNFNQNIEIPVSYLSPGFYMMHLSDDQGHASVGKFIKL